MSGSRSKLRFLLPCIFIVGTGLFLETHAHGENLPTRQPLSLFPMQIGDWSGREIAIPDDVRQILGSGDFMERLYSNSASRLPVDLFIAYFPTQRTGSTIHSPQHCLPGAGWMPVEKDRVSIGTPGTKPMVVNQYVIAKGLEKQLVLYWYQSHGRVVASEYWAKFYLVADSIRMNRSDGALVRIITPIGSDEGITSAQDRAVRFAHLTVPLLNRYIPK